MASEERPETSSKKHNGFVPILVARSRREADEYCQLFSDHDIPAIIGDDELGEDDNAGPLAACPVTGGVRVLVEEDMLDEAKEIVADREDLEEFQTEDDKELDNGDDDEDFRFVEELGDEDPLDDQDDYAGQKEDKP